MQENMSLFLSYLLHSSTQAQAFHRQTTGPASLSIHLALGSYYEEIIDLVDGLTESYQGKYDLIKTYKTYPIVDFTGKDQVIAYFEDLCVKVDTLRKAFPDSYIQNQIDSIAELLYSTKYKLRFLS
jgi:hypothetical protein